ncbi:MAG: hypothetical protein CVT94_15840 [Bacteroidetes bacterium HGW-Bacteroidetes-11]|jgi:hypothetical protein|nr:MAG: hypothetical protein CVT94_15840 [Bacteroidetes bacterium HGW-Bacteroidetes-11]
MKNLLVILIFLFSANAGFAQVKSAKTTKAPGVMIGLDSTLIKMEYAHWNNANPDEYWERFSSPNRIVFYCKTSGNVNKSNVAHVYDFDENGVNVKYTTIATQEKFKYACDYLNTIALRNKYVYEFQGVNENNQGVWVSSKAITNYSGCDCGNLKVTVTGNLNGETLSDFVDYCPVKPGKSDELIAIEYMALNQ